MRKILLILIVILLPVSGFTSDTPRLILNKMFKSVAKNWFPNNYYKFKSLELSGEMSITVPYSSVSRRLKYVQGDLSFAFNFDGVLQPSGVCKFNLQGDFGNVVYCVTPTKTITYSEDFNAYSISDSNTSNLNNFKSYFIKKINLLKDNFSSGRWNFQMQSNIVLGGDKCYKVTAFTPPPKEGARRNKRSNVIKLKELLTFYKKGKVVFFIRAKDYLPLRIEYSNDEQNIDSTITFFYGNGKQPASMYVEGTAANVSGRGDASIGYGNGILSYIQLSFSNALNQSYTFNANFNFKPSVDKSEFLFLPPSDAQLMGRENLKLLILSNVAGTLLRMQQAGINIKTLKF
ncbi:hypothetical protein TTHT_0550 [Thermotomaculum hydrothermale]|uniref:Uncharacterized protein n=1 Tax=Thermotomaculum hydrothermale TaxID=981385 RepID=A0A7R6PN40_9BACT|nr:hypothetical protein [Thermotomaculum hydrothermale]BBB32136.1 hypothetical protein TTHT_0550 [Thermotomaculum hydrothermale]